ncbi:MAG TPA: penicillin acylase family protein [Polyangiaceae bacterium]
MRRAVLLGLLLALSCDQGGNVVGATDGGSSLGPFGSAPAVTSTTQLAHLSGPVDVVRDKNGLVHIWATSTTDALRVEGYQCARDRSVQLELLRRFAEGRTAELLGDADPSLIDQDITMRMIGLGRVATQMYDALAPDSELKAWLDAYSDGISQFFARVQSGDETLPKGMIGISHGAFTPWTGADSLAIGRLESYELAYTGDSEIAQTTFVQAARTQFAGTKRANINVDLLRFAPLDPTLAMDGFPDDTTHSMLRPAPLAPRGPLPTPVVSPAVLAAAGPFVHAAEAVRNVLGKLGMRGSNDWIVGPQRTATGHAMLANDPHLSLSAPSVFWLVQIDAHDPTAKDASGDLHVQGTAFPGIPGIILGFNQHIAWGATTADYDVTDVYSEKLTPDGTAVVFKGQNVPLQKVREEIAIAGSAPIEYDVLVVPHHGPIVPNIVNHRVVPPDPTQGAMSIAWTGSKATNELAAVSGYLRATSVEDFRAAVRQFAVGAQNWVVADTGGNIFYTTQSQIPLRDPQAYKWDPTTFTGTLPCFVEPGDGTAEWTGQYLDEAFVPHVKNPAKHYVGTANGDQVGGTLDNDPSNDVLPNGQPIYLACWHDPGFRVGRIHQLIEGLGHPATLDDLATIQADARSALGAKLAPGLLTSLAHAEAEAMTPGTHPDLTSVVSGSRYKAANVPQLVSLLQQWGTDGYDTPPGVSLDDGSLVTDATQTADSQATLLFQTWLMRAMQAVLGDELTAINQNPPPFGYHDLRAVLTYLLTAVPSTLATYDATTGDSVLFDDLTTTGVTETRDERQVTSLLDALDFLATQLGSDRNQWRWGKLHTLRFESLVSLWQALSIPPTGDPKWPNGFPRHGDGFNIDVGEPDSIPVKLADATFTYGEGPTQRFVIDMDPSGPVARNVLPGGEIWDNQSPHFRDEAELWRRNENHPLPFAHDDVLATAESRVQYKP